MSLVSFFKNLKQLWSLVKWRHWCSLTNFCCATIHHAILIYSLLFTNFLFRKSWTWHSRRGMSWRSASSQMMTAASKFSKKKKKPINALKLSGSGIYDHATTVWKRSTCFGFTFQSSVVSVSIRQHLSYLELHRMTLVLSGKWMGGNSDF